MAGLCPKAEAAMTQGIKKCMIDGCDGQVFGRGWCNKHYKRWWRNGDPLRTARDNTPTICAIDGCGKPVRGRGWCSMHYTRWHKHGDPNICLVDSGHWRPKGITIVERLLAETTKTESGCWLWQGTLNHQRYGVVSHDGRSHSVHRAGYSALVGEIPEGLTLDHLCRVRHCWNPAHLEPVTIRENLLRGDTLAAINSAKTHCVNGHRFSAENTYLRKDRRGRECRTCRAAAVARSASKNRNEPVAVLSKGQK
jgi:hypothetical protein